MNRTTYFSRIFLWGAAVCFALVFHSLLFADTAVGGDFLRRHHAWGRFSPGSWRRARITTRSLEKADKDNSNTTNQESESVSNGETRTVLTGVSEKGVVLRVESSIEVAGKRIEPSPQVVEQTFYGESVHQPAKVKDLSREIIEIEGKKFACQVQEVEVRTPMGRTVTKSWISDEVAPFVLRRHSVTTDPSSGVLIEETKSEITALRTPFRLLNKTYTATEIRVVHKHPKGKVVTQVWNSLEVPGGVLAQNSEEFDLEEHLLRTSKLEVLEYGTP